MVNVFPRQVTGLTGELDSDPPATKATPSGRESDRAELVRGAAPAAALSPREREIARLVAQGLPNKAIGQVLEISAWTVATHLRRMYVKLNVSCRAAMVAVVIGHKGDPI
jgi:DNA-binding CsgD family transcriptional regulator